MSTELKVKYYNSFVLRKIVKKSDSATPNQEGSWPGLPWDPTVITSDGSVVDYPPYPFNDDAGAEETVNWYLEEARIKGGFNNDIIELGARAYAVNKNFKQSDRSNGLIFSGIYNDRTSINNTNVFSVGENIVKDADAMYGSIQKLYAEDTNLLVFQENKVHKALINKDTIYSGDQGAQEALGRTKVIGQLVPFLGEYGISRNPESFAIYGYRKYFADKDRSAVLRLSRDGITEISFYGMRDYFRDEFINISDLRTRRVISMTSSMSAGTTGTTLTLNSVVGIEIGAEIEEVLLDGSLVSVGTVVAIPSSTTVTISTSYEILEDNAYFNFVTYKRDKVYGGWDSHSKNYTTSLQTQPRNVTHQLVTIEGEERGTTFNTLSFDENAQGWTSFYSYQPIFINSLKNKFYTFIDDKIYEHYADIGSNHCKFYGRTTPDEASVELIFNPNPSVKKNFNTISYEGDNGWEVESMYSSKQGVDDGVQYQDASKPIKSYDEGAYTERGVTKHAGFDRKENRYVANIVNGSTVRPGEVIFGASISGIKGYFTTVKLKVDDSTNIGGVKELYSASSNYVLSSY
jgi:hypothetical protein